MIPAAAFLITRMDGHPNIGAKAPCCAEIVAAPEALVGAVSAGARWKISPGPEAAGPAGGEQTSAASLAASSRAARRDMGNLLPVGVANEAGLQVDTILAARAVSAAFPEIREIGGVRPDPKPWHPNGLAIDIMIPDPSSDAGIALGNEILDFALRNADRFDLQDVIWRDTYYTPAGPSGSGYGHFDHVHITTHGGGYPTGNEVYTR